MRILVAMEDRFTFIRIVNISAVNIIIYALIHLRYLQDTQAALAVENAQLKFSNLETRYRLLKDQVNPHFLFNALGTAKSLMRRDTQLAEAYIVRLSDFLRASLDAPHDSIPLRAELKHVRDYIALQQMRFRDALHYDCTIDPNDAPARLPFFSLLTLVENAVKHNQLTADTPLSISVTRIGDKVRVTNNLQRKTSPSSSPHTGLDNLRARLHLLGHGDLLIEEDAQTYSATFQLLPE
jgi:LytS/YehU family sensor histidine kinase